MPMGNGGLYQEPLGSGGRLAVGAPSLPAPDLSSPLNTDTVCSCEACYERRWVIHQPSCFQLTQPWHVLSRFRDLRSHIFSQTVMVSFHWSGRSRLSPNGSLNSCRITGLRWDTWSGAFTVKLELHWLMIRISRWTGTKRAWRSLWTGIV